ncbi:MAG: AraC family transcriptional regulator [Thermoflexibacter sp.]|nr:AraC family transcriptional regulator [Thermoflexibacter sp.]
MEITHLLVKNMVCDRCIMVIRSELQRDGFSVMSVKLGEVEIEGALESVSMQKIEDMLNRNGFELVKDKKDKVVEQIKKLIIQLVHRNQEASPMVMNYSDCIARALDIDYTYLSTLFSTKEGITIEKYIILQKIERVKELLAYQELTLSEIAYQMNYSSVQHLSNQFKKVTGLTPSEYKLQKKNTRKALDKVGGNKQIA